MPTEPTAEQTEDYKPLTFSVFPRKVEAEMAGKMHYGDLESPEKLLTRLAETAQNFANSDTRVINQHIEDKFDRPKELVGAFVTPATDGQLNIRFVAPNEMQAANGAFIDEQLREAYAQEMLVAAQKAYDNAVHTRAVGTKDAMHKQLKGQPGFDDKAGAIQNEYNEVVASLRATNPGTLKELKAAVVSVQTALDSVQEAVVKKSDVIDHTALEDERSAAMLAVAHRTAMLAMLRELDLSPKAEKDGSISVDATNVQAHIAAAQILGVGMKPKKILEAIQTKAIELGNIRMGKTDLGDVEDINVAATRASVENDRPTITFHSKDAGDKQAQSLSRAYADATEQILDAIGAKFERNGDTLMVNKNNMAAILEPLKDTQLEHERYITMQELFRMREQQRELHAELAADRQLESHTDIDAKNRKTVASELSAANVVLATDPRDYDTHASHIFDDAKAVLNSRGGLAKSEEDYFVKADDIASRHALEELRKGKPDPQGHYRPAEYGSKER